jgi:hypothetical protein
VCSKIENWNSEICSKVWNFIASSNLFACLLENRNAEYRNSKIYFTTICENV